ncbi:MAG: purine-nucleoside phosphorylase [Verrucomicrobia bacterium]|nr:purine-nucleoside phosphorylase [Verrucomicrobiota bacterium]
MQPDLREAAKVLHASTPLRPRLGIVLGSAFGQLSDAVTEATTVAFADLPGFAETGVDGHAGQFVIGRLGGVNVLLQAGRLHYYEGHSMAQITFPVRVMAAFGVEQLLLTNAAGGIAEDLAVGDFMRITDHINLMGANPLRGEAAAGLPVFVDMSETYSASLGQALGQAAADCGIELKHGIFAAVPGPSYETPAEIRAFASLGADAIAMSTVPEAIVARQLGLEVVGLSCITNAAAGLAKSAISHEDVLQQSRQVSNPATRLLMRFCELVCTNGTQINADFQD